MAQLGQTMDLQIPDCRQDLSHLFYQHQPCILFAVSCSRTIAGARLTDTIPPTGKPIHHSALCDTRSQLLHLCTNHSGRPFLSSRVLPGRLGNRFDGPCSCLSGGTVFLCQARTAQCAMILILCFTVAHSMSALCSVRSAQRIFFFPRAFFFLFCLVHFYLFSFPFGFAKVAMGMIVCFILQCLTFFWNRFEVPAVALNHFVLRGNASDDAVNDRTSILHVPFVRNNSHQQQSPLSPSNALYYSGGDHANPLRDQFLEMPPQAPSPPIHYTYSQGAFSQGRMSRASSEAIFQRSGDVDDESESCLYFLGGKVVIRSSRDYQYRGTLLAASINCGHHFGDTASHMATFDSMSTLQSVVVQLGPMDETGTSSLQTICDLTPQIHNSPQGSTNALNTTSSVASFSMLDSSQLRNWALHHS